MRSLMLSARATGRTSAPRPVARNDVAVTPSHWDDLTPTLLLRRISACQSRHETEVVLRSARRPTRFGARQSVALRPSAAAWRQPRRWRAGRVQQLLHGPALPLGQ